ncbi:MAG TPA: ABC transporter C-terminal domain-containing protein, partial [Candidatus Sulfotelmatobacter sp.]
LGLDGQGGSERFADYSQWEAWQADRLQAPQTEARETPRAVPQSTSSKKKLSYLEAREYASIEERVAAAEQVLDAKRTQAEDPAIASDAVRLMSAHADLENAQQEVDELYTRWAELEKKQA